MTLRIGVGLIILMSKQSQILRADLGERVTLRELSILCGVSYQCVHHWVSGHVPAPEWLPENGTVGRRIFWLKKDLYPIFGKAKVDSVVGKGKD